MNRLPPGFRFQPTDEELLFEYLRCKIYSLPLPASIIPEVRLSSLEPWELPGDSMEEKYFFTTKGAKYKKGNHYSRATRRATNSGYWEEIGLEEHISPSPSQNLGMMKGLKKTFVFNLGKSPNNSSTDWFMHEYSLVHNKNNKGKSKSDDWIICHIFLKQRITEETEDAIMVDYNSNGSRFNSNIPSPCSSSSSSSNSFAQASSYDSQSDEESSYNFM